MQRPTAIALIVAALMIRPGVVQAEPARLACEGKMRVQNANGETAENYVLSLVIDQAAGTVTVGSYGTAPILSQPDSDAVVFMAQPGSVAGVSTGSINRFTGVASVHIITLTDGLYKFYGRCKPAQRLF